MSDTLMTRSERDELGKVVRLRAKVTKAKLQTLAADRQAEVEAQLSAIHKADEAQWKEITAVADRAVKDANGQITRIADELGIPKEFRPSLGLGWYGRGDNSMAARRAELRKLAYARIEADRKAGYELVEEWSADKLTVLISGALASAEAKAFLESLPSAESMLPPIRVSPELDGGIVRPQLMKAPS